MARIDSLKKELDDVAGEFEALLAGLPAVTRRFRRKNWKPSSPSIAKPGTLPTPIPEPALPEPPASSTNALAPGTAKTAALSVDADKMIGARGGVQSICLSEKLASVGWGLAGVFVLGNRRTHRRLASQASKRFFHAVIASECNLRGAGGVGEAVVSTSGGVLFVGSRKGKAPSCAGEGPAYVSSVYQEG